MPVNEESMKRLELESFSRDLERIENQELDIIYDSLFDCVCDRKTYDRMKNMMEWKCAICGDKILVDKKRNDVENFVCDKCMVTYNNKNTSVDFRILESRSNMYKELVTRLYDELEDNLFS